jgi:hypothetical protein
LGSDRFRSTASESGHPLVCSSLVIVFVSCGIYVVFSSVSKSIPARTILILPCGLTGLLVSCEKPRFCNSFFGLQQAQYTRRKSQQEGSNVVFYFKTFRFRFSVVFNTATSIFFRLLLASRTGFLVNGAAGAIMTLSLLASS